MLVQNVSIAVLSSFNIKDFSLDLDTLPYLTSINYYASVSLSAASFVQRTFKSRPCYFCGHKAFFCTKVAAKQRITMTFFNPHYWTIVADDTIPLRIQLAQQFFHVHNFCPHYLLNTHSINSVFQFC